MFMLNNSIIDLGGLLKLEIKYNDVWFCVLGQNYDELKAEFLKEFIRCHSRDIMTSPVYLKEKVDSDYHLVLNGFLETVWKTI